MALPYTSHHISPPMPDYHLPLEHVDPPCLMSNSSDSFGFPEVKASGSHHLTLATSSLSLSSSSPRSSLYLAVRLRSLVDSFRKRVKQRPHVAKRKKADGGTFCRDIEREAYVAIDRYLGRRPKRATGVRLREGVKRSTARDGAALSHDKAVKKYAISRDFEVESQDNRTIGTLTRQQ